MQSLPTLCRWYSTGHPTGPRVREAGELSARIAVAQGGDDPTDLYR
jgi:hypothetical protein